MAGYTVTGQEEDEPRRSTVPDVGVVVGARRFTWSIRVVSGWSLDGLLSDELLDPSTREPRGLIARHTI